MSQTKQTATKANVTAAKTSVILSYSTTHLTQTNKVRFYYALKGRNGKQGIIKAYNIEQLGKTVLLVPETSEQQTKQFLEYWKCKYTEKRVVVQP